MRPGPRSTLVTAKSGPRHQQEIVDSAPKAVKEKVGKDEAEGIKKQLEEAGATVTLK